MPSVESKQVHRIYEAMGLNLSRRKKRRLSDRTQQPPYAPRVIVKTWSIDFMSDALYSGKRFCTLNAIDDGVREVLSIVINTSLPGGCVFRTIEQIAAWRGLPSTFRLDNGPQLISQVLVDWCEEKNVQHAFIERFNKTYRMEVLNAYLFRSLDQVREITDGWL